jgi:branched-chain amino acid transport system permease protein
MTQFLQATVAGLSLASIYALLALGFVIIFKSTQVLSFAHPALMIFGAYFVSYFAVTVGINFWLALVIGVVLTALLGAAIERFTLRRLIGKPLFSLAILTIGLDISIRVVVNNLIGVNLRGVGDPWGFASIRWGGVVIEQRVVAMLITAVIAAVGFLAFFKFTRVGLAMRATASDQEVAMAQGISVHRIFALAWILGGALAAVAGMFAASGAAGLSQNNWIVALKALPAIVVGGLDSVHGAIVGALIIGLAEGYSATYQGQYLPWLGNNFSQVVPYLVMLIVLLIKPYGLFGTEEVERV